MTNTIFNMWSASTFNCFGSNPTLELWPRFQPLWSQIWWRGFRRWQWRSSSPNFQGFDDDGYRHHEPHHHQHWWTLCCSRLSQIIFQLSLFLSPQNHPKTPASLFFRAAFNWWRPQIPPSSTLISTLTIHKGERAPPVFTQPWFSKLPSFLLSVFLFSHSLNPNLTTVCLYNHTSSLLLPPSPPSCNKFSFKQLILPLAVFQVQQRISGDVGTLRHTTIAAWWVAWQFVL